MVQTGQVRAKDLNLGELQLGEAVDWPMQGSQY